MAGYIGIDGVARKVGKLYVGMGGIARSVTKAYVGGADGKARLWYQAGKPLGSYAAGKTVQLQVNGIWKDFIVVQRGAPDSSLYTGGDGIWLLLKDVHTKTAYDVRSSSASYPDTAARAYCERTFVPLLSAGVRSQLVSVQLPYYNRNQTISGDAGCASKCFLLSQSELTGAYVGSYTSGDATTYYYDGAQLDYFKGGAASTRVAYYQGAAAAWWTRTPYASRGYEEGISATGAVFNGTTQTAYGIRPCIILPKDTPVGDDGKVGA